MADVTGAELEQVRRDTAKALYEQIEKLLPAVARLNPGGAATATHELAQAYALVAHGS